MNADTKNTATSWQVTIPAKWLLALAAIAAQEDHHKWLNGVSIADGFLFASDGFCMGSIRDSRFDGMPPMTIPRCQLNHIQSANKRLPNRDVTVRWTKWFGQKDFAMLDIGASTLMAFLPDTPDIASPKDKLLFGHTEPAGHPQIDVALLEKFRLAAEIFGAPKNCRYKVHLIPNGDDNALRVKLPEFLAFEGAVMPLTSQHHIKPEQLA